MAVPLWYPSEAPELSEGNELRSCRCKAEWAREGGVLAPSKESLLANLAGSWEKMQVSPAKQFPMTQYLELC